jgi:hypothetical protein
MHKFRVVDLLKRNYTAYFMAALAAPPSPPPAQAGQGRGWAGGPALHRRRTPQEGDTADVFIKAAHP